ncbi:MAG TPA: DMT family transporter [Streptosporangiaceae bacterium]|nr:DMT family transporter [Streptosporangiaceae bacterium]
MTWLALAAGAAAMACVGGSVAVSGVLSAAPFFTAEGVRYLLACLLLVGFTRLAGIRLHRPRGAEWLWLSGITGSGLVAFNIALVEGARHAEPAVLGVAVSSVPPVLAVIGPLLERSAVRLTAVLAGVVVTGGAAAVQGFGRTDAAGVGFAAVVLGTECAFTLLAIPVLGRHGPAGVSVHTTGLAAVLFCGIGALREGPAAVTRLTVPDWLATGYLAVFVTAVAFVLWYTCVSRTGASRAGLLTGVAPVTAAATGVLLGRPAPGPLVWAGTAVVLAGLALGLRRPKPASARPRPDPPHDSDGSPHDQPGRQAQAGQPQQAAAAHP